MQYCPPDHSPVILCLQEPGMFCQMWVGLAGCLHQVLQLRERQLAILQVQMPTMSSTEFRLLYSVVQGYGSKAMHCQEYQLSWEKQFSRPQSPAQCYHGQPLTMIVGQQLSPCLCLLPQRAHQHGPMPWAGGWLRHHQKPRCCHCCPAHSCTHQSTQICNSK